MIPPNRSAALQAALNAKPRPGMMAAPPPSANVANNFTGGLAAPVPGRTDALPISVPQGSYVIPADIVSALGEGNSINGLHKLEQRFGPPQQQVQHSPNSIDIMAAGGEFIVPPQEVVRLGNGDIKQGHAVLDAFVEMKRKQNVKTLQKMPGPKR